MHKVIFLQLVILATMGCGAERSTTKLPDEHRQPFSTGYRSFSLVDSSRYYKPNTTTNDSLHYRTVELDLWYPAHPSHNESPLRFGYFLKLLQQRANFYSAPQRFDGLDTTMAKSLCEGFACSQYLALLKYPTKTFEKAKRVPARFPLIIYLASYGSMGYENYRLFETLTRRGYVVASVSSIGRYPGEMTMKNADLMEQVYDAEVVLRYLKKAKEVDIDTSRIGAMGYSWGGLAAVVLAMPRKDIRAVVSLDGSEFHHYGYAKEEDRDFEATVNTASFNKNTLSVPYLRLQSNANPTVKKDSVFNFLTKVTYTKRVVKIDSATHQDFSAFPFVTKSSGNCPLPPYYQKISDQTVSWFDEHLSIK